MNQNHMQTYANMKKLVVGHHNHHEFAKMHKRGEKLMQKRIKPIEYGGTLWYQCGMCGEWSNHIEHIANDKLLFENLWDEQNVGQMMGYETYCVITINNVTKPFICALCVVWECGMDEKWQIAIESNKTTYQIMQNVCKHA